MSQPRYKKCGDCPDCTKDPVGGYYCKPIKDKYGAEPVYKNQKPSINCHRLIGRSKK